MTVRQSTSMLGPLAKIFSEMSISARCSRFAESDARRSAPLLSLVASSTKNLQFGLKMPGESIALQMLFTHFANRDKREEWGLLRIRAEGEDGVQSAEGEGVGEGCFDALRARRVGNVVEVTFRIAFVVVRGGGQNAVMQGEHRGDGFQSTGRAQGVPVHGLGGADANFIGVRAEYFANGRALDGIISRGAGPVSI